MNFRQALIPVFSLLLCVGIIYKWTNGFKAFTIFSYTLEKADPISKTFPEMNLLDHTGEVFNIQERSKFTLVNFVYLSCPDVCHKVNNQLEELYHLPQAAKLIPSDLELLTISFDMENDDVERIDTYRKYFLSGDIDSWTFSLPYQIEQQELFEELKTIGVWAYQNPDSYLINHSIYLYLLSPDQKIVRVFDPARQNSREIINEIQQCIGELSPTFY